MKKGALIAHYAFGKKLELAAEVTEGVCMVGDGGRAGDVALTDRPQGAPILLSILYSLLSLI